MLRANAQFIIFKSTGTIIYTAVDVADVVVVAAAAANLFLLFTFLLFADL